jgi:hypothetical protein
VTLHRDESRCRYGFEKGDLVWTPLRRRAILTKFRATDGRWDARYVNAIDGQMAEETILAPANLCHAD